MDAEAKGYWQQYLPDDHILLGNKHDNFCVRTNGAIELYTITQIDLNFPLVIHPWNAERDDTFRLHQSLYQRCFLKLRMLVIYSFNTHQHLAYCLQIFTFTWMFGFQTSHKFINVQHKNFLFNMFSYAKIGFFVDECSITCVKFH